MDEQDVNAANSEMRKLIADAESLLRDEQVEVKEETKEEIKEEVKEEVKEEIPDEVAQTEEVSTTTEKVEPPPETEPDHGEKSRLGRKVKYLEDKLTKVDSIDQKLDALFKRFDTQKEEPLPDLPTGEDVVKIVDKVISKREQDRIKGEKKAQESYQSNYLNLLDEAVGEDEELRNLLVDPKSPFNKTSDKGFFGNPAQDLLLNITKATKALRAKVPEPPKPNVKGVKSSVPTGVNVPSTPDKVTVKKTDTSKWDKESQSLANSGLFSDEELAELARI